MRDERPERRRNRAPEFPGRRPIVLNSEADYLRACARAGEIHAAAAHNPMTDLELERLALAILTWELKRGGSDV